MRKKDIRDYKDIKRVLIVVDMVNGFCKEGVMADNKAMDVVGLQKVLIGDYLNSDDGVVVFVKEAHSENAVEFKDFPRHCVEGESESMIIDELDCYVKDSFVIGKNCTSFMVVSEFKEFIDKMSNLESVMGCGVCIDICVPNGIIPLKNYFNQNNLLVPSTNSPIDHTARTFKSSSRARISASLPFSNVPLRSATPMMRAGVSEAIRTASSKGISAF